MNFLRRLALQKEKLDDSSRLVFVRARHLTCFRACFIPGRAKDLSAPGLGNTVRGYDRQIKGQRSVWKKARQVRSNTKVLFTVFFDENCVLNRRVNKDNCLQILRRLSATQYVSYNEKIGRQRINKSTTTTQQRSLLRMRNISWTNKEIHKCCHHHFLPTLTCEIFNFQNKIPSKRGGGRGRFDDMEIIQRCSKQQLKSIPNINFQNCSEEL